MQCKDGDTHPDDPPLPHFRITRGAEYRADMGEALVKAVPSLNNGLCFLYRFIYVVSRHIMTRRPCGKTVLVA